MLCSVQRHHQPGTGFSHATVENPDPRSLVPTGETVLQLAARLPGCSYSRTGPAGEAWSNPLGSPQLVHRANRGPTLRSRDSPLDHSICWPAAPPPPSVLGITHQGKTPLTISTSAPGCLHPIEQLADRNFDIGPGGPSLRQRPICVLASNPRSAIGFPTSRIIQELPFLPAFWIVSFLPRLAFRTSCRASCSGCDAHSTLEPRRCTMAAMSHLSHLTALDCPDSRVSLALSDTTYHSFQDIDSHEPGIPSRISQKPAVCSPPVSPSQPTEGQKRFMAREMRRQDSGYESIAPRDSLCSNQRTSSSTSLSSSTRQRHTRPSGQRSPRSKAASPRPRNGRRSVSPPDGSPPSLPPQAQQQQLAYFYFPHFTSSDPALVEPEPAITLDNLAPAAPNHPGCSETPEYPPPPQTTHYWTSDQTRRLEYAAIDAASKGVRGWVMRHVVPDCFVPQSKRRVGFEDDRGSVVRYRLDLDTEESADKEESARTRGWRGWWSGTRRR